MRFWVQLSLALMLLPLFAAQADQVKLKSGFPDAQPAREECLVLDQQSSWTLRQGDQAAPLAVIPLDDRVLVSLSGGWLILGPDLGFRSESMAWLPSDELSNHFPDMALGTPVAAGTGMAVLFQVGSKMGIFYPESGTVFWQPSPSPSFDLLSVTSRGISATEGRRVFVLKNWNKTWAEAQPLPFFPSDLTASISGRPWACDSLGGHPWLLDGEFWNRLDVPEAPGRMTGISPFPDESGYFACGPSWVGAFKTDGSPYWVRTTTLSEKLLPADLKIRVGSGRLYLWSALARRVWVWSWNPQGPSGDIAPEDISQALESASSMAKVLALRGGLPEAVATMAGAVALANSRLIDEPFSTIWSGFRDLAREQEVAFRGQMAGSGTFTLSWSHPNGSPLADWDWQVDAGVKTSTSWLVHSTCFWEGTAYETREFRMATKAQKTPWPGVAIERYGPLQLPSWMNLEIFRPGEASSAGWARIELPTPVQPYDLPTE